MRAHVDDGAAGHARSGTANGPDRARSPVDGTPAVPPPGTDILTPGMASRLQATAGNRATATLLAPRRSTQGRPVVQRELDPAGADRMAIQLREAMEGWGTDEEAVYGALSGRTPAEIDAITTAYGARYDTSLVAELEGEFSGDELDRVRTLLAGQAAPAAGASDQQRRESREQRALGIATALKEAMYTLGTEEAEIFNALEGRTSAEIEEIERQYANLTGVPLADDLREELSGEELDRALGLIGAGTSGAFRNTITEYLTEGLHAGGEGIWTWEIQDGNFLVHVEVTFQPDPGVTYNLAEWQAKIADTWNRYALVADDGAVKMPVLFDLSDEPEAARHVRVAENEKKGQYAGKDRAYSDLWYPVMPDTIPAHEFGHLVGLADEYERTREDYKAVTEGETIVGPKNESGLSEKYIAKDLHRILFETAEAKRPGAAQFLLDIVGLIKNGEAQQGDFAQAVMAEYQKAFGADVITDIRTQCPPDTWLLLIWVFSYTSTSIMGSAEDHTHPVAPRHLKPILEAARSGLPDRTWDVEAIR